MNDEIIRTEDLRKDYVLGAETVHALRGVDLLVERNEYIAIMGPSGSGKSTFMNLIGCLDTPTKGSYLLNEKEVASMNDDELAQNRNEEIGAIASSQKARMPSCPRWPGCWARCGRAGSAST